MGPEGLKLIENLKLKTINRRGRVQLANSQIELVSQEIIAPIELQNQEQTIAIRILKSLPVTFAIGLDFCKNFKLSVDFHDRTWTFKDSPNLKYKFELEDEASENCCGLRELSKEEADLLKDFLTRELPKPIGRPGLTDLIKHTIDVGDHSPINNETI